MRTKKSGIALIRVLQYTSPPYAIGIGFLLFILGAYISLLLITRKDEYQMWLDDNVDAVTIWSNDFHISPIRDLKSLIIPLGVRVIDESLAGLCGLTNTCAKFLQILNRKNGLNPSEEIRRQFYEFYKNHSLMNRVDAFVCFHPASMCELFMPFNRTIIVIASTRYELGRFQPKEWKQWNRNLRQIAADPRNIVAGNNLYDAEYIRYFTGINATVLPSLGGYTNTQYNPNKIRLEFLYSPARDYIQFGDIFLTQLNKSLKKSNSTVIVKKIRMIYKFYSYKLLARHPGIIHLPFQVSMMSLFEQYTMNIPLFFPSLDLLTHWHFKYKIVSERTSHGALTGVGKNHSDIEAHPSNTHIPDPNNDYDLNSIRYWLAYADYYQWPHIILFNSIDDLVYKLIHTNLNEINARMRAFNIVNRQKLVKHWQEIINRIRLSSFSLSQKNKKQKNS